MLFIFCFLAFIAYSHFLSFQLRSTDIDSTDMSESFHEGKMEDQIQTSSLLDIDAEQQCHSSEVESPDGLPKIGMKFESEDHAYRFYNAYAGLVGFSVRKDFKNRSKIDGSVMSRRFVCFKRGFRHPDKRNLNVKKPHKEVRTGCLAQMTISRQSDGRYRVIHFEAIHNHEVVGSEYVHALPSHRKLTVSQVIEADLAERSGIQRKLTFKLMGKEDGIQENVAHLPIDLHARRTKDMKRGEAGSLLYYFQSQQTGNPMFFYAVQLDMDEQITNIFWADSKMMIDYSHFGDVVYFDTTYRTNQLCRPLTAFIGVNHHKEMLVFGAALLYDEAPESFHWLFQTFMQAMSGRKPRTILTVQDMAIAKAIGLVFPATYHRICIWNMWQNAMRHLGHLVEDQDEFGKDFRNCIYEPVKEEEFFQSWESILDKYGLRGNAWLVDLFKEKEKWAMVYGRRMFCGDLKSTWLSDGFNSCLRKYLKSDLDILQFFNHFERMVVDLRDKELQSNIVSQRAPILETCAVVLKHAWDIYSPEVFEVFQKEFEDSCDLVIDQCNENGPLSEYKLSSFGKLCQHTVAFNSSDETVECSCMKFEYAGILCSHALKVLDVRSIKVVPEKYILKRWTKDARVEDIENFDECITKEDPKLLMLSRYKDLTQKAIRLSTWAADSEEGYLFLNRIFKDSMVGLEKIYSKKYHEINKICTDATQSEDDDNIEDANYDGRLGL